MSYNRRTGADIITSADKQKQIDERIEQVEKHLGNLCQAFGGFSRKTARLRDKGDEVCKSVKEYSQTEQINKSLLTALRIFAENLSAVQDFRDSEIKRLENKVVYPLSDYGNKCKLSKKTLKDAFQKHEKETQQLKKLERVRDRTPSDRHGISNAESELERASTEAVKSDRDLEESMEKFEKDKLSDIKKILLNFVNTELIFHAKAVECYTQCYNALQDIDEDNDLECFRSSMRMSLTDRRRDLIGSNLSLSESRTPAPSSRNHTANNTPLVSRENRNQIPTVSKTGGASGMNGENGPKNNQTMGYNDDDESTSEEEDDDDDSYEESIEQPIKPGIQSSEIMKPKSNVMRGGARGGGQFSTPGRGRGSQMR